MADLLTTTKPTPATIILAPKRGDFIWPLRSVLSVDGDTLAVMIDRGFGDFSERKLRLIGVQAPEIGTTAMSQIEREAGLAVRDLAIAWLNRQSVMSVRSNKWDKYAARILGDIVTPDETLAEFLLMCNVVKPWDGRGSVLWSPEELAEVYRAAAVAMAVLEGGAK